MEMGDPWAGRGAEGMSSLIKDLNLDAEANLAPRAVEL